MSSQDGLQAMIFAILSESSLASLIARIGVLYEELQQSFLKGCETNVNKPRAKTEKAPAHEQFRAETPFVRACLKTMHKPNGSQPTQSALPVQWQIVNEQHT